MKTLIRAVLETLKSGNPVVLVSVIASSGSTPRGAGAMMAVFKEQASVGTIGGGAVEFDAVQKAKTLIAENSSKGELFVLEKKEVSELGMICGGAVTIAYEYIDPDNPRSVNLFSHMLKTLDVSQDAWIVRKFTLGSNPETALFDKDGLHFAQTFTVKEINSLLRARPVLTQGNPFFYIEPLVRAGRVIVFGGGHVAQELVPVLARIGFVVDVYDDRPGFATKTLFPDASKLICAPFEDISLKITKRDYIIVMTRGHAMDYEVLEQMLRTSACYMGCIGSAKKTAAVKERLMQAGISKSETDKLVSPIGLDIHAVTPAEIAVSIAAQLIKVRAGITE